MYINSCTVETLPENINILVNTALLSLTIMMHWPHLNHLQWTPRKRLAEKRENKFLKHS